MHPFRSLANELGKSGFIFEPAKVRLAERDSFNTKGKWDRHTITLGKPVTWSFEAVGKDGISEWLHLTYLEESRTEKTFRHFKSEVESKAQEGVPGVPHIKLVIERGVKDYRGRISLPEYKEGLSNYTLRFRGKNHEQVLSTKAQSKGKSNFSAEDQQAIKAIMGHIKRVGEDALPLPNKEETPEERPPEKTKGFFVRALSLLFPEKPQPQEQTVDPKIEHAERARAHILSFLRKFGKT